MILFIYLASYTADSIGSAALGINCQSFTDPEKNFVRIGHKTLELDRVEQFLFILASSFPKLGHKLGIRQVGKEVSNFFTRVITETIKSRRENNIDRADFIQLLMKLQEYSDDGK